MNLPRTCDVAYALDERELFSLFVRIVEVHDPDVIAGYEVQRASLGYLLNRGTAIGEREKEEERERERDTCSLHQ